MLEDLGVWGDKRVPSVTSEIDVGGRRGDAFRRSQETVPIGGGQGRQGREGGGGIGIEPEIEGRGIGRVCTE